MTSHSLDRPRSSAGVIPGFSRRDRNPLALLFTAPDVQHRVLAPGSSPAISFSTIGGTSIADPFTSGGAPFTSKLSYLHKKGVATSTALTASLTTSGAAGALAAARDACLGDLPGPPRLYLFLMPLMLNLAIDDLLQELYRLAGPVPVIGGILSADYGLASDAILADGRYHADRAVLVALAGEVRPKIALGCDVSVPYKAGSLVTRADRNVIRGVDGMDFAQYLAKVGYDPRELGDLPLALRVLPPGHRPGDPVEVNSLVSFDAAHGSATFTRNVEPGSLVSVCFMNTADIARSTRSCLADLKRQMGAEEERGYRFDTVFCISCVARYYADSVIRVEPRLLSSAFPDWMNCIGFYSFGEIAPVAAPDGSFDNRSHSHTLALCAI